MPHLWSQALLFSFHLAILLVCLSAGVIQAQNAPSQPAETVPSISTNELVAPSLPMVFNRVGTGSPFDEIASGFNSALQAFERFGKEDIGSLPTKVLSVAESTVQGTNPVGFTVGVVKIASTMIIPQLAPNSGSNAPTVPAAAVGGNPLVVVPQLVEGLNNKDDRVKCASALALGAVCLEPMFAVPALVSSLSNTNRDVRIASVMALGCFGSEAKPALPLIAQAVFTESDPDVRCAMAKILAAQGGGTNATDSASNTACTMFIVRKARPKSSSFAPFEAINNVGRDAGNVLMTPVRMLGLAGKTGNTETNKLTVGEGTPAGSKTVTQ